MQVSFQSLLWSYLPRVPIILTTTVFENLGSEGAKINQNIETLSFKVLLIKFLAIHTTNQKLSFDMFTVGTLHNISIEHDLYLMS